ALVLAADPAARAALLPRRSFTAGALSRRGLVLVLLALAGAAAGRGLVRALAGLLQATRARLQTSGKAALVVMVLVVMMVSVVLVVMVLSALPRQRRHQIAQGTIQGRHALAVLVRLGDQ